MDRWVGKVAVVTGASSGIGAATVRALAHQGVTVVGLARREDRTQQLGEELAAAGAPGKVYAYKVDLRQEVDILAAFAWVDSELGGADIIVNNAGIFRVSYLSVGDSDMWRDMLNVNVLAVAICTREYLKSMEKRNNHNGHIFFINSVAGHLNGMSQLNMYSATKHGLRAISMSLRQELAEKKSNIKVTSVSPGLVATEIWMGTEWEGLEKKANTLSSDDVSQVIIDALSASPVSQICEVVINPIPTDVGVY